MKAIALFLALLFTTVAHADNYSSSSLYIEMRAAYDMPEVGIVAGQFYLQRFLDCGVSYEHTTDLSYNSCQYAELIPFPNPIWKFPGLTYNVSVHDEFFQFDNCSLVLSATNDDGIHLRYLDCSEVVFKGGFE